MSSQVTSTASGESSARFDTDNRSTASANTVIKHDLSKTGSLKTWAKETASKAKKMVARSSPPTQRPYHSTTLDPEARRGDGKPS
ncbi:hypothetical protein P7C73_g2455, partial [Tremellales sp. Uapishka_1]